MNHPHSRSYFNFSSRIHLLQDRIDSSVQWTYHNVLPIFYPRHCPLCDHILPYGTIICPDCKKLLPFVREPVCYCCGKPINRPEQEYCFDCRMFRKSFQRGLALFLYDEKIHLSMMAFKYGNRRMLAQFFAHSAYQCHRDILRGWHIDAVVPVPIHKNKRKKRGYNQAALLAKELAALLNLPCYPDLLLRIVDTLPQKQFSPQARLNNLQNVFRINPRYGNVISSHPHILLIDDIYTTGATMEICSRILLDSGIQKVYVYSICIGISRD